MTMILAHYEQYSYEYKEDNWSETQRVSTAEDFFEFMRSCYIRDAHNRNDFPIVSCWDEDRVKFYEQDYTVCDLGHNHFGEKTLIPAPTFYLHGRKIYDEWVSRIKRTVTHLRSASNKRVQEVKEREELVRLQEKYS